MNFERKTTEICPKKFPYDTNQCKSYYSLYIVTNHNLRLISEMLHIKMQKTGVNLMKDTEYVQLLDPVYIPLINKFDL